MYNFATAAINAATGTVTPIASSTGNPIKVYGIWLTAGAATNLTLNAAGLNPSGPVQLTGAGSAMTLQVQKDFYFYCPPGVAFTITNSGSAQLSGAVYYSQGG